MVDNLEKPKNKKDNKSEQTGAEKIVLYEARKNIFPKDVKGKFRRFKWLWVAITVGVFVIAPWLRWDRGPYASDQLVLIDLANRRFFFAGIEIWPQEFYYVTGLLIMAGVGLFLITSVLGRAWCGYSCPQTVWTDVFIWVERKIEGDRNARLKLEKSKWTFEKIFKFALKYIIWLIISILTGVAFVTYFAEAPQLVKDIATLQAASAAYITIAILTATTFIFAGFMREQMCIYACPWPRIQGTMLDENSLTVTYNDWRGEPRSRSAKKQKAAGNQVGDCVDCDACVAVCPTGIDIRDGQQIECITCALCIDACDNVMEKLGLEKGLISYATLKDYTQNIAYASANNESEKQQVLATHHASHNLLMDDRTIIPSKVRNPKTGKLFAKFKSKDLKILTRPRTILYFGIWAAIGVGMLVVLALRNPLDMNVLHDRNPLYVSLSDGSIRNGYDIKILNMIPQPNRVELKLEGLEGAKLSLVNHNGEANESLIFDLPPDEVLPVRLYITLDPENLVSGRTDFRILVNYLSNERKTSAKTFFEVPAK
ncbi:Type cbb3 cytochrome oxidase biogenesis protein CcoG, involved in Cu oxidation [hydrothermal vent metagenome]|uniref:Type cbb3 cytochrome oxidase biogenesis protein CcoG, involved in Cu oxidation n=1 Tax=hydrothermal vent metagenome TaxID=652676 RepID=A0A3B0VVB8_9ZZZZ